MIDSCPQNLYLPFLYANRRGDLHVPFHCVVSHRHHITHPPPLMRLPKHHLCLPHSSGAWRNIPRSTYLCVPRSPLHLECAKHSTSLQNSCDDHLLFFVSCFFIIACNPALPSSPFALPISEGFTGQPIKQCRRRNCYYAIVSEPLQKDSVRLQVSKTSLLSDSGWTSFSRSPFIFEFEHKVGVVSLFLQVIFYYCEKCHHTY